MTAPFSDGLFQPPGGFGNLGASGVTPNELWTSVPHADPGGAAALAIDTLFASPIHCYRSGAIDRLAFLVSVVGGAGSVARGGIYRSADPGGFWPAVLVVDGGQQVCDVGVGGKVAALSGVMLRAGFQYWFAYLCGVAAPTVRCYPAGAHQIGVSASAQDDAATSFLPWGGMSVARAYGALPAAFPAGPYTRATAVQLPVWSFRYSS